MGASQKRSAMLPVQDQDPREKPSPGDQAGHGQGLHGAGDLQGTQGSENDGDTATH